MVKGKKKDDPAKILSEFKIRLEGREYLNLAESVKRFEKANGRKPSWDERKDMAKYSHIGIEDFCALLKDNSFDDICQAIGLAWSTRGPGLRGSHPRV
jgi:preprotein translocase subunit Sss1